MDACVRACARVCIGIVKHIIVICVMQLLLLGSSGLVSLLFHTRDSLSSTCQRDWSQAGVLHNVGEYAGAAPYYNNCVIVSLLQHASRTIDYIRTCSAMCLVVSLYCLSLVYWLHQCSTPAFILSPKWPSASPSSLHMFYLWSRNI